MNWDAINAVSQFVSSIAVVLSVLYLAKEVHRSTRVARVAAQDAAASAVREVTKTFMENAEMSRIWGTGLEEIQSLSREDQARFFHATHQFLKALETIHFHHINGLMDEQLWHGWQELLRHYIVAPGIGVIGKFGASFSRLAFALSSASSSPRATAAPSARSRRIVGRASRPLNDLALRAGRLDR